MEFTDGEYKEDVKDASSTMKRKLQDFELFSVGTTTGMINYRKYMIQVAHRLVSGEILPCVL